MSSVNEILSYGIVITIIGEFLMGIRLNRINLFETWFGKKVASLSFVCPNTCTTACSSSFALCKTGQIFSAGSIY